MGDDEEEDGLVEDNAKPPNAIQKLAIGGITKIINALERRAKGYKNKSYRANLTLSAGLDVAIPLGFIGMSISCSATVDSLVKYAESKASQK